MKKMILSFAVLAIAAVSVQTAKAGFVAGVSIGPVFAPAPAYSFAPTPPCAPAYAACPAPVYHYRYCPPRVVYVPPPPVVVCRPPVCAAPPFFSFSFGFFGGHRHEGHGHGWH